MKMWNGKNTKITHTHTIGITSPYDSMKIIIAGKECCTLFYMCPLHFIATLKNTESKFNELCDISMGKFGKTFEYRKKMCENVSKTQWSFRMCWTVQ